MTTAEQSLIQSLDMHSCLRDRMLCRVPPPAPPTPLQNNNENDPSQGDAKEGNSFVLYLPTVVLRKKHNPGFALACRLANHYGVPLVVLVTLLDDQHLSRPPPGGSSSPVVMTSRRLAFWLEALQESACPQWESHGAGVAVRVHASGCRTPHHLSLAHAAKAVVTDEPFVEPYREYVRKVTKTCRAARVPVWTVDGSTSVPPNSMLVRKLTNSSSSSSSSAHANISTAHHSLSVMDGDISFAGAPSKAWRWEKQTDSVRKHHVYGAYRERALDAPALECKLPPNFFLCDAGKSQEFTPWWQGLLEKLPSKWKDPTVAAPGNRPWSVQELCAINDCKAWALEWKGADPSVPPCPQTHGSAASAKRRWRSFLKTGGLKDYAKKRNAIASPFAVSRISCYLNLGILSIFEVLHDVWEAKGQRGYSTGCNKFLEEVGKWREGSYVHCFAHPNYHTAQVLPLWARTHLESLRKTPPISHATGGYDYEALERAATGDETWNAMQEYLIDTGELHNNARMTWGKTVVHWQAARVLPDDNLWQLCCLNDRFALDGLSPPSYGGVLWCFGWQDKPSRGNQVSEKWAHRYRTGPSGFAHAKEQLVLPSSSSPEQCHQDGNAMAHLFASAGATAPAATAKRANPETKEDGTTSHGAGKKARSSPRTKTDSKQSILSYFGPAASSAGQTIG